MIAKTRVDGDPRFAAVLGHALRRLQRANNSPLVTSEFITRLEKEGTLPTPVEQAENLVLWLGEDQSHAGDIVRVEFDSALARIGAVDRDGVRFILDAMEEQQIIEAHTDSEGASVRLSFEGWQEFDRLVRQSSDSPRAFMAMKFGDDALDDIFLNHFKPAVADTGFALVRLDESPQAGLIDVRLRVEIRRSRFLVADLTEASQGAYWEAGFAEGLGKPVIYTCEKSVFEQVGTHFDTNHMHTISWTKDKPELAAEALKATIRETLPEEARMSDHE